MLKSSIDKDLKIAMLSGDKRLVAILRDIKSAILNKEVAENARDTGLDEATILAVLKKEQKTRKESVEIYEKAGELVRADKENYQLEVIQRYLPEEMSEDDTNKLADSVISEIADDLTMKDMGRIISAAKQRANNVDGGLLARIVKEKISK